MKPEAKNIGLAEEDYHDSLYLFQAARYPNAVYLLCQAIEKLLKAVQVEVASQPPQKTHNLEKLGRQSKLPFSDDQLDFLNKLTTIYERVRYRDLAQAHYNTKAKVELIIHQGQTVYLWILNRFKNH